MKEIYLLHAKLNIFRHRIKQARDIIRQGYEEMSAPYCSLSFGKDSLVLAHLLLQDNPDLPLVYVNCGKYDEWPDTGRVKAVFVKRFNPNLTELKAPSIMEAFLQGGFYIQDEETTNASKKAQRDYGKSLGDALDGYAKKMDYDGSFIGVRKEESDNRARLFAMRGPLYFSTTRDMWACHPLAFWTGKDIWAYIFTNDLPYNELYDLAPEGRELARNGAMFGTRSARYGRLVFLKKMYPSWFNEFAAKFPEARAYT